MATARLHISFYIILTEHTFHDIEAFKAIAVADFCFLTPLGNKPFENTVEKGEIARNEQFLLYSQCFPPV